VSSDLPWLPANTILTTPSSADPVIRSVLPPWARFFDAQRRTHATFEIAGLAT
jgi:hypothetical protein